MDTCAAQAMTTSVCPGRTTTYRNQAVRLSAFSKNDVAKGAKRRQVEKIIEESIAEFKDWTKEMEVSPTIQKLKGALEQIRKDEIARHMKDVNTDEAEVIDVITKSMMQKIIKLPVLQLKAACKRGEAETLIDVLNDIFNLEDAEIKK